MPDIGPTDRHIYLTMSICYNNTIQLVNSKVKETPIKTKRITSVEAAL